MRILLCLFLALSLALPGQAQLDPEGERMLLVNLSFWALRHGDYRTAESFIRELSQARDLKDADVLVGPLATAPMVIALGRSDYDRASALALELAERARQAGRPDRELSAVLVALVAARQSGRPQAMRTLLPRVQKLASQNQTTAARYALFVAESYVAEQDFRRQPPSPAELLARHNQTFAHLQNLTHDLAFQRDSIVEARLLGEATKMWQVSMLNSLDPQLIEACASDIQLLLKIGQVEPDPNLSWDESIRRSSVQGLIAMFEVSLNFASAARAAIPGFTPEARKMLAELEPPIREMYKTYQTLHETLPPEFRQHPVLGQFIFCRGDIPRIAALTELEFARQILAEAREGGPTPALAAEMQRRVAEGRRLLGEAEDPSMVRDLTFEQVEALLTLRPEGWQAEADRLLSAMLSDLRQIGYRPGLIRALTFQGRLRAEQNRKQDAVEALQAAVKLLEEYIAEVGGGPETARRIRQESRELYELLARLQLEAGNELGAVDTLDRFQQLSSASSFTLRDLPAKSAETEKAVQRATEAQNRLAAREEQLQKVGHAQLADSKSDYYQALAEIQRKDKNYTRLQVRPNTFARVQRSLPEDTVLIQLFPSDTSLFLFVATRDSLKVRQVDVPRETLEKLVADYRSQILRYSRAPRAVDWAAETELMSILGQLEAAILKPLEADLAGKKVAAFVLTGSLVYMPFQALARIENGQPRFLIESMQVVTLVKASDLDQLDQVPADAKGGLVALGDPDASLPSARTEVAALEDLFPGSRVYIGSDATRDKLVSATEVSYVHLATHGILDPADPTRSYLLLAPAGQDAGHVTVTEIAGLPFSGVHLVTLSACQTALAEKNPDVGADLTSLADAFSFAGSPSLVASLWKVEDRSTQVLMGEFYTQLKAGVPRGEALRRAQLALMQKPEYRHPFYWAPFVLMGDWR